MPQPTNVPALLQPYVQAYSAKDLEALVACFSEDAILRSEGPVGTIQGKVTIRAFFKLMLPTLDDMKLHRIRYLTLDQEIAALSELTMALPGLWAEPRHFVTIQVFMFDEAGLISNLSTFVDVEGAVRLS
jgi:hypothetical protein